MLARFSRINSFVWKLILLFAGSAAIGIQCNTTKFQEMKRRAMQPYLRFPLNIFTTVYPNVARFFGVRKHAKEVSDFFIGVINQTIQSRANNNENRNDFLQLLMGSDLTTNLLAALAFDFLSAGYSDSTSTLSYCLYELSLPKNAKVQKKARKEIELIFEQHGGEITYAALEEMTYCKSVIKGNFQQIRYLLDKVHHILNLMYIRFSNFHHRNLKKAPCCRKYYTNYDKTVSSAKHRLHNSGRNAHLHSNFGNAS